MTRDLLLLGHLVEIFESPRFLVLDQARNFELPCLAVDLRRVVFKEIGIERKRSRDRAFGKFRCQNIRIEDRGLNGVVELRDPRQHRFGRKAVADIAAGEQRQRAETRTARDEPATRQIGHQFRRILDKKVLVDAANEKLADISHDLFPDNHRAQAFRHQQRKRNVHHQKPDDQRHAGEMDVARDVIAAEDRGEILELHRLPDRQT